MIKFWCLELSSFHRIYFSNFVHLTSSFKISNCICIFDQVLLASRKVAIDWYVNPSISAVLEFVPQRHAARNVLAQKIGFATARTFVWNLSRAISAATIALRITYAAWTISVSKVPTRISKHLRRGGMRRSRVFWIRSCLRTHFSNNCHRKI